MIVRDIEIARICEPKMVSRVTPNDPAVATLTESITQVGLINPITVKQTEKGKYEVVAGHRRFIACKSLGLEKVACNVIPAEENIAEAIKIIENIERRALTSFEQIMAIANYVEQYKVSLREAARIFGIGKETVVHYIRLSDSPDDIKQMLHAGKISNAVALELSRLKDEHDRRTFTKNAIEFRWSAPTTRQNIDLMLATRDYEKQRQERLCVMEPDPPNMITYIDCQMCDESVDMNEIHSLILCDGCMNLLMAAKLNEKIANSEAAKKKEEGELFESGKATEKE